MATPTTLASVADAGFTIDRVYPWGRTLDEYRRMFALSDDDMRSRTLAVADGPASFNAEMTAFSHRVVSCDPLYRFSADEIRGRVNATRDVMIRLVRENASRFVWNDIVSPEALGELRIGATECFLNDYAQGKREGRYVDRSLPRLGFDDDAFDLALCSHFLFLYAAEFPLRFHVDAMLEMVRLSRDVRIFPLLDLRGEPSPHVDAVVEALRGHGFSVGRQKVDYEFQRGGNEMLRVTRSASTTEPRAVGRCSQGPA
jgi:hypothetical protein